MKEKVVIVGAGIGGLTAAHELIDRDFDVHVYERRPFAGGKAASQRLSKQSAPGASGGSLPHEHGFRFFPGWYRHLPDTMSRIPYKGAREFYEGDSVAKNLATVAANRLAWSDQPFVDVLMHRPATFGQARETADLYGRLRALGLNHGELAYFFARLVQYQLTPAIARKETFGKVNWWDYLEAGSKSPAFQALVHATTRLTIAAKAKKVNADTLAKLAIRTLLGWVTDKDGVLNGPTSEVFIDRWKDFLRSRGVTFHFDHELVSIELSGERKAIDSLRFASVAAESARKLRRLLPVLLSDCASGRGVTNERFEGNWAFARRLLEYLSPEPSLRLAEGAAYTAFMATPWPTDAATAGSRLRDLKTELDAQLRAIEHSDAHAEVKADYFVFGLPVEQMAYYINRSGTLRDYAPGLRRILKLVDHTDWMSGVQFYLNEPVDWVQGHLIAVDSPWALTGLEQTQFWREVSDLPSDLKAVLSIDISAWDEKGRFLRKEAFNCTDDEIAHEVWEELKRLTSRANQPRVLRDDMLRGGSLKKGVSFHVDDSLVDLADRKKQGAYERARGLFLSREDDAREKAVGDDAVLSHMWGPRLRFNAEPLLINEVGTHDLRPEARTELENMFLAADYVRTETDLACMEGANEAGRRAVNALLEAAGSKAAPCRLFSFAESTLGAEKLTELLPLGEAPAAAVEAARATARTASDLLGIASRAFNQFLGSGDKRK